MPTYTSTNPFTRSTQLIDLAASLNPVVEAQPTDLTVKPSPDSGGVDVLGATRADLSVKLREWPFARTARYIFNPASVDLSASESIGYTLGSATGTVSGPWANFAAMIEALRASIASTASAVVTVSTEDLDGDGVNETVKVVGVSSVGYAVRATIASTTTLVARADAETLSIDLYGRRFDSGSGIPSSRPDLLTRRRGWANMTSPDGSAANFSVGVKGLDISGFSVGPFSHVFPYVGTVGGVTGSPADSAFLELVYSATVYQGAPEGYVVT